MLALCLVTAWFASGYQNLQKSFSDKLLRLICRYRVSVTVLKKKNHSIQKYSLNMIVVRSPYPGQLWCHVTFDQPALKPAVGKESYNTTYWRPPAFSQEQHLSPSFPLILAWPALDPLPGCSPDWSDPLTRLLCFVLVERLLAQAAAWQLQTHVGNHRIFHLYNELKGNENSG